MNIPEILALYDQEQRIQIEYPGMQKERLEKLVRFLRPAPGMSFISYSWLDPGEIDPVIQEQIADFGRSKLRFSWYVCDHDRPAELKKRLLAHGFQPSDPDALMALDLKELPAALQGDTPAHVQRITRRELLADVIQIQTQAYGGDFEWIWDRLGVLMETPELISLFVTYMDAVPVSTGWVIFHPNSQFANLKGGATIPEQRGKGLYTAILAARAQEARRRGRRYLLIDAGAMSQPIAARHGFQLLTSARDFDYPYEETE